MNNSRNFLNITDTSFCKVPNFLFTDARFQHISNDAKLLYAYMGNRKNLSKKNNWQDENGIYILFSREEMAKFLHCTRQKAGKIMNELKSVGLICEKRQGLNKANLIYVYEGQAQEQPVVADEPKSNKNPHTSGCQKNEHQEGGKTNTNKKYIKKINTDPLSIQSTKKDKGNYIEKQKRWIERVKEQIDYIRQIDEALPQEIAQIDQLVGLITDIYTSKQKFIRIRSESLPREVVCQQFQRIDADCFSYVLISWTRHSAPIHHIRAYLLTMLYNAPDTVDGFWINEIQNLFQKQNQKNQNGQHLIKSWDD